MHTMKSVDREVVECGWDQISLNHPVRTETHKLQMSVFEQVSRAVFNHVDRTIKETIS